MSRDPIGEEGGLNLFLFLNNNSVSKIDLLGLERLELTYDMRDDLFSLADYVYGKMPSNSRRVSNLHEIIDDLRRIMGGDTPKSVSCRSCKYFRVVDGQYDPEGKCGSCISKITLVQHGDDGEFNFGEYQINDHFINFYKLLTKDYLEKNRRVPDYHINKYLVPMAIINSFLGEIKSKMCTDSSVIEFAQCEAYTFTMEKYLKDFFGDNVQVILYKRYAYFGNDKKVHETEPGDVTEWLYHLYREFKEW